MTGFASNLIERLASAGNVAVLTGAGASAESGIPTFRDPGGLWSRFNPAELASFEAFRRDPIRVQSWYSARIRAVLESEPNPCHVALAELEALVPSVSVITQNVDGLHKRAGSSNVIELHGNLLDVFCATCGRAAETLDVAPDALEPARCECGGLIRPRVVWFGETLPADAYESAVSATARADVFISIGTSGEVYPAAGLPRLAAEAGAYVLEINVQRTPISGLADEVVLGAAGIVVPQLLSEVRRRSNVGVS